MPNTPKWKWDKEPPFRLKEGMRYVAPPPDYEGDPPGCAGHTVSVTRVEPGVNVSSAYMVPEISPPVYEVRCEDCGAEWTWLSDDTEKELEIV